MFLGLGFGTSGVKAVLVDAKGVAVDQNAAATGLNLYEGPDEIARQWGMEHMSVVAGAGDNAGGALAVGVIGDGQGMWHQMSVHVTAASCIDWAAKAFSASDASEVFVNIEANHATLSGHTMAHEIAMAHALGIFGSIDANRGDPQNGVRT